MRLVLESVITQTLYVIKHDPLNAIAPDAISNKFEYILGLLDQHRIGEVQVRPAALLDRTGRDTACLQLFQLSLYFGCPGLGDRVFESRDEGDPLACQPCLSHFKTHQQAVLAILSNHVVEDVEPEGRLAYLLWGNYVEHIAVFHTNQAVEFRPLENILGCQINLAVQFILKLRQSINRRGHARYIIQLSSGFELLKSSRPLLSCMI